MFWQAWTLRETVYASMEGRGVAGEQRPMRNVEWIYSPPPRTSVLQIMLIPVHIYCQCCFLCEVTASHLLQGEEQELG